MNIKDIKKSLGYDSLPLVRAVDAVSGAVQPFLVMWDATTRQRLVIHDETMKSVNTAENLQINRKTVTKEGKEPYTQIAIFLADPVEITL